MVDQALIVMSVDEGHTAECILATKNGSTPIWRFVTADIMGANLEYTPRDGASHFTFAWTGAGGGSLNESRKNGGGGGGGRGVKANGGHNNGGGGGLNLPFTRLDG
jgi:hypothetical protein